MSKLPKKFTKVRPYNFRKKLGSGRDDSPQYKEWHKAVLKRDGYCCKWPGCGAKKKLQVHHIRKWAVHLTLRYQVSNGITLCRQHHSSIWGKEEQYEHLFLNMLISVEDKSKIRKMLNEGDESGKEESTVQNNPGQPGKETLDF